MFGEPSNILEKMGFHDGKLPWFPCSGPAPVTLVLFISGLTRTPSRDSLLALREKVSILNPLTVPCLGRFDLGYGVRCGKGMIQFGLMKRTITWNPWQEETLG
jgi:hypothetical protein